MVYRTRNQPLTPCGALSKLLPRLGISANIPTPQMETMAQRNALSAKEITSTWKTSENWVLVLSRVLKMKILED